MSERFHGDKRDLTPSGPVVEDLDLSKGWDTVSHREIVIDRLKELGIYRENLLIRGFNGDKIEVLLEKGIESGGDFFASTPSQMLGDRLSTIDEADPLTYADGFENPALAFYDGTKFEKIGSGYGEFKRTLLEGNKLTDALLAVFKIKY